MELSENQENTRTRLREFRKVLGSGEILESFDRVVFESVVEKIIIGGYNDEGVEEPLKITFVYKTGIHSNFSGKDFKPKRKNAAAVHNDTELCSYTSDEAEKLCLHSSSDTHRDNRETFPEKSTFPGIGRRKNVDFAYAVPMPILNVGKIGGTHKEIGSFF